MKKKYLNRRRFLRHLNSVANETTVHVKVVNESWTFKDKKTKKETRHRDICASLKIRDCSKAIALDFWVCKPKQRERQLAVLDTLIGDIQDLRDALAQACEDEFDE